MKKFLLSLFIPLISLTAISKGFEAEAILIKAGDGGNFRGWIVASSNTQIRYKTNKASTQFIDGNITDFETINVLEPREYSEAMDLYEGRKYREAREKFAKVKEVFKPLSKLTDNFHTLAAFYEMECVRHMADYKALSGLLKDFIKAPLTRDHQIRQLDLYTIWDAIGSEDWDRALLIATEREAEVLPVHQRAQIAFCKGLALDKLNRDRDAVISYNKAITADASASEILAQQAAINSLAIYYRDKEVQTAIANWETEDENKNSNGYSRLKEAAALYNIYDKFIGLGKVLPADLNAFGKFVTLE